MNPILYIIINVGLVIVNIGLFIWTRYDASKIRKITLKDDFWFRTIALPMLLKPLEKFSIDQTVALRKIVNSTDSNVYNAFYEKFITELYNLIDRCYVINSQSPKLYKSILKQLQKMEDLVTEYCHSGGKVGNDAAHQFIRIYTKIISLIMKFHSKNTFDDKNRN